MFRVAKLKFGKVGVLRRFSGEASNAETKKKFEIPYGFIASVGIVGAVVGWFYRSYANNKILLAKRAELRGELLLSPDETEQIRTENSVPVDDLKPVLVDMKRQLAGNPIDFGGFVQQVEHTLGKGQFKSAHLIDRYIFGMKNAKLIPQDLLIFSTVLLGETIDDRMELVYDLVQEENQNLSHDQMKDTIRSLNVTCQLPVRVMVREHKEYPYNVYKPSEPEELLASSLKEVNTKRKKAKTEPIESEIDLEAFKDLLLSYNICAWGECN